jgi:LPXTG-motif cell wall-anchored protein
VTRTVIDLILPKTDAGVAVQVAAALVLGSAAVFVTWRRKEWRLVAIGATLLVFGFFGLRALH